jgi:predicted molibdopterin-dependent oxidoreductase YjgC
VSTALASVDSAVAITACPFCGSGCTLTLADAEAFPVLGDPVTRGALCLRGWSAGELLDSPLRVLSARMRIRGSPLAAAPVETVLLHASSRIAAIRAKYGPASVGILTSARLTLEELHRLADLAHVIGTPHLDALQRLGSAPGGGPSLGLEAIERAARILVVGTDLSVRHPQAHRRVLEALGRGVPVRFVGANGGPLATFATEWIRCVPGGEVEAAAQAARPDDLVLWSSELALHGQAGPAQRRLGGPRSWRLPDFVNQLGLHEAGIHPRAGGLAAYEMLQRAAAGEVKALLVFADDPFEFFPALAARAFAGAEFVLVVDAVATRAAEAADMVLPGSLLAEKVGTLLAADGSRRTLAAARAPAARLSEGEVAHRLALSLGGGLVSAPRVPEQSLGPDGPAPDAPTADYPLIAALDGASLWGAHPLVGATVTARREAWGPRTDFPGGWVSINPADAKALGVRHGWTVRVEADIGALTLAVRVDPHAAPGTALIPMHCWERAGTALGALEVDPCLRIPIFRPRAVRIGRQ